MSEVSEKFMSEGILDMERLKNRTDGRVTAGHFSLLKRLKQEDMMDELICIDQPSHDGTWQGRDEAMVQSVLSHMNNSPLLVVAGNLHTRLKSLALEGENDQFHPLGELIRSKYPDVPSIQVVYGGGSYFNLSLKFFDDNHGEEEASLTRSREQSYNLYLPEAHAATVPQ